MRGQAYRRAMKRNKDKRLRKIITDYGGYNPHAGYIDYDMVDGKWQPSGTHIKYPRSSNMQKWLKKTSNRKVRRSEIPSKGNGYRKCSEYWWIMY